jgi:hypothetical protein
MGLHDEMRVAANGLTATLSGALRAAVLHPFADEAARRWMDYRPVARPGVSLASMDIAGRKAAHRLLSTALSDHAFAQAMTIASLEEVLDRSEGGARGRHAVDYWLALFGDPSREDDPWGWRFEGHHVSVSMTIVGDRVSPTPLFLGANPARVRYRGTDVVRPLALEEELARALLDAMDDASREAATIADEPPDDIVSEQLARIDGVFAPVGVAVDRLGPAAKELLDRLVDLYLERLAPWLARREAASVDRELLTFAWAGSRDAGRAHYYRIQAPDLLIEYDNTQSDANHVHSVLRRPASDFGGGDVLRAHRAAAHAEPATMG